MTPTGLCPMWGCSVLEQLPTGLLLPQLAAVGRGLVPICSNSIKVSCQERGCKLAEASEGAPILYHCPEKGVSGDGDGRGDPAPPGRIQDSPLPWRGLFMEGWCGWPHGRS